MKFLHEMMPIFRTEFSEFLRRGIGITYKTALISAIFGFKNTARVIVIPVFIQFTGSYRKDCGTLTAM